MIDGLRSVVVRNASTLGLPEGVSPEALHFTKFCQRIVQPHTKVLFLLTHEGRAVCVLKVMRFSEFDERLRNEKASQVSALAANLSVSPAKVFFEDMIDGRYVYAEEVVEGIPVSPAQARTAEADLMEFIRTLPHGGEYSVESIVRILEDHALPEHPVFKEFLDSLSGKVITLSRGLTHGDLGLPNILRSRQGLYIIDWERANDVPLRFLDACYLMSRLRDARTLEAWRRKASADFVRYTGTETAAAEALFSISRMFEILYRQDPERYHNAVRALKTL